MMGWYPTLVISFRSTRHSRSICTNHRYLIGWINLFASERSFGSFAAFATPALLREESGDPSAVDEIAGTGEEEAEEEVEEDTE